jgi:hypothetical protein
MLSLLHCDPLTCPTLKAALSGYHIILAPAPLTGGGPGSSGSVSGPVKTTLLSFTCSIAAGAVVLIPTLPIWPVVRAGIKMLVDNIIYFVIIVLLLFLEAGKNTMS